MKRLKSIGAFAYDFVVGDDWRVAVVVVAALALTALLVHAAGVNAWWLLPVCVFAALGWSLRRAVSGSRPRLPPLPALYPERDRVPALVRFRAPAGSALRA